MKHLRRVGFPVCCGAEVIGYFGYAKNNIGAQFRPPIKEIEEDLAELDNRTGVGFRCLTLASEQREFIEPSLKKFNYKMLVENFYHPGHGSKISLYGKVLHPQYAHKIGEIQYGETKGTTNRPVGTVAADQPLWGQGIAPGAGRGGPLPVW